MFKKIKEWLNALGNKIRNGIDDMVFKSVVKSCHKNNYYPCKDLILSMYFETGQEGVIVNLSRWEQEGLIHYILFTKDKVPIDLQDTDVGKRKYINMLEKNAIVYLVSDKKGNAIWRYDIC